VFHIAAPFFAGAGGRATERLASLPSVHRGRNQSGDLSPELHLVHRRLETSGLLTKAKERIRRDSSERGANLSNSGTAGHQVARALVDARGSGSRGALRSRRGHLLPAILHIRNGPVVDGDDESLHHGGEVGAGQRVLSRALGDQRGKETGAEGAHSLHELRLQFRVVHFLHAPQVVLVRHGTRQRVAHADGKEAPQRATHGVLLPTRRVLVLQLKLEVLVRRYLPPLSVVTHERKVSSAPVEGGERTPRCSAISAFSLSRNLTTPARRTATLRVLLEKPATNLCNHADLAQRVLVDRTDRIVDDCPRRRASEGQHVVVVAVGAVRRVDALRVCKHNVHVRERAHALGVHARALGERAKRPRPSVHDDALRAGVAAAADLKHVSGTSEHGAVQEEALAPPGLAHHGHHNERHSRSPSLEQSQRAVVKHHLVRVWILRQQQSRRRLGQDLRRASDGGRRGHELRVRCNGTTRPGSRR